MMSCNVPNLLVCSASAQEGRCNLRLPSYVPVHTRHPLRVLLPAAAPCPWQLLHVPVRMRRLLHAPPALLVCIGMDGPNRYMPSW